MHIPEHSGERLESLDLRELEELFKHRVKVIHEYIAKGRIGPENLKEPFCNLIEVMNAMSEVNPSCYPENVVISVSSAKRKR